MRKRSIVFMAILVLLVSMVGCGKTEEPVSNGAESTITEAASNDVVNDVEPTEIPEVEEPTVTEAPEVEEPTVTEAPEVTETPEVEETNTSVVVPVPNDLRAEKLNYEFEGVYWKSAGGSVYYYDGQQEHGAWMDLSYDPGRQHMTSVREYTATDSTYAYSKYEVRNWRVDGDQLIVWIDGGTETTYTAISKEKAIELYPIFGITPLLGYECAFEGRYWLSEDNEEVHFWDGEYWNTYYKDGTITSDEYTAKNGGYAEAWITCGVSSMWEITGDGFLMITDGGFNSSDKYTLISKERAIELFPAIGEDKVEAETPSSTPVATDSLEDYRVEALNYDFEGIYWLDENGNVRYFDGENETVYYPDSSVKVRALREINDEYFVYADNGFGVIWYINDSKLYFCLGDYSVYNTLTPLTKEQAVKRCPAIGGAAVEDNTQNESVEATAGDFEGKYWVDSYGMSCRYYDNGEEVVWYSDGDTRNDNYVVNGDTIAFGEYEYKFWIESGKLYMEPLFSDGFGGETMVYTEITKDEFDQFVQQ